MHPRAKEASLDHAQHDSAQEGHLRIRASDGNRELHLQVFSTWLHPDLRDLPGIDWTKMPSSLMGHLVNTVGNVWHAPHVALAAGAALGAIGSGTLARFVSDLNVLLSYMQTHCNNWSGDQITRTIWEEYITQTKQTSRRRALLLSYSAITERHLPDYLERLDSTTHMRIAPYVLPRLPAKLTEQYGGARTLSAAQRQRRKEKSDVLVPLHAILVALIQLRKQSAQRLLDAFREACQHADAGATLPLRFSYREELVEINRDAATVADVRLEKRPMTLEFKLWKRKVWIRHHPDDFSEVTKRKEKHGYGDYSGEREADAYFVEYLGSSSNLLWFGGIIANGLLMHLTPPSTQSQPEVLVEQELQRLAYARSIGVSKGFTADRPGLLTPGGGFGQSLSKAVLRSKALLFDPESLYRGCLLGAALATLALTNGSRCAELLQVSADRFKGYPYTEKLNGLPTGKERVIWLQLLLPKGKKTEAERQLFPISPQSYELLREIAKLLRETHGSIPVVQPHARNSKAEDLSPERYLFQWSATPDGHVGALGPGDVQVLLRFILHGLEFCTRRGEPFVVSTHLLRHVMATAARQDHQVPPEVLAFVLHHQQSGLAIPVATEYYTEMTEEQRVVALAEFLVELEEQAANILLSVPNERTMEQMDEDIRDVFERWHVFLETTFGFCGCVGLCPRGYARNLCIGCPHLVPNPRKRENAVKWRTSYARQAEELESAGEVVDARQVRLQVQELNDLINSMDVMQQAIEDGTRQPAFLQLAPDSSHEVIIDAEA